NRLNTEGKRIMCVVDSTATNEGREEIFVNFEAGGKTYTISKRVKTNISKGDSVPVYYMEENPSVNGISSE
ncbi:MAG TPA: hypothetical protein VG603_00160, partial [Chitinophagales bacterium]|nr:hypothetical protein [Chitinophagales bacterium]